MVNNINLEIKRNKNKYFLLNFIYIYLLGIFIIVTLGFLITSIANYNIYSNVYKINQKRIELLDNTVTISPYNTYLSMCIATNCAYLYVSKKYVHKEHDHDLLLRAYSVTNINTNKTDMILTHIEKFPSTNIINNTLTKDLYTVIPYKDKYVFLLNNNYIFMSLAYLYIIITISISIVFTFTYVIKNRFRFKEDLEEINRLKYDLEDITQKNMISILNHELVLPILEGEKVLNEILEYKYGCDFTEDRFCINNELSVVGTNNENLCETCKFRSSLTEFDKLLIKNIRTAKLDLGRIESVLNIFKRAKNIKTNNGTVTLKEVILGAYENIKIFNINKCVIKIEPSEILNTKSVGYGLNNTDILNIFTNLFKNIREANGNMIYVRAEYNKDCNEFANIYIKDNGTGIKDKHGKILTPEKASCIFEFGNSSKNVNKPKNILEKIANIILYKILKVQTDNKDVGIGMYLNKTILESAKGSIKVISTSRTGTEIMITIPIKDTIKIRSYEERKTNYGSYFKENITVNNKV
ncbi:ATP-binding protein [Campylobacter coli]